MKLYSVKAIKSTEKDLFPAWWHVLALSHPQGDVQHRHVQTEWHGANGFGDLCVLETRFYKLLLSNAEPAF